MDDPIPIVSVLNSLWPDEVDILGDSTVIDVARSVSSGGDFIESGGGADFDVKGTLDVLIAAATLVKVAFEIRKLLAEGTGRTPTKKEVETTVQNDTRVLKIDREVRSRLSEIVDMISATK